MFCGHLMLQFFTQFRWTLTDSGFEVQAFYLLFCNLCSLNVKSKQNLALAKCFPNVCLILTRFLLSRLFFQIFYLHLRFQQNIPSQTWSVCTPLSEISSHVHSRPRLLISLCQDSQLITDACHPTKKSQYDNKLMYTILKIDIYHLGGNGGTGGLPYCCVRAITSDIILRSPTRSFVFIGLPLRILTASTKLQ